MGSGSERMPVVVAVVAVVAVLDDRDEAVDRNAEGILSPSRPRMISPS